jgi:chorismate synthase
VPLSFRSAGESHGRGCLAVLEGLPKDLPLDLGFIDGQLARRQRGHGRSARQRLEHDRVEILTGARAGRTLEAPLCLWVGNQDASLERLPNPTRPRPGHADLSGCLRHGDRDIRANIERASARETVARVAAGAVAQLLLRSLGVEVLGHVVAIGPVGSDRAPGVGLEDAVGLERARQPVTASELGTLDAGLVPAMRAAIDAAREAGDTLGGVVEVVAAGVPGGWGSFAQWTSRLDGRLAQALMSSPAV